MKRILLLLMIIPVITQAQTIEHIDGLGTRDMLRNRASSLPADKKALIVINGVIQNSDDRVQSSTGPYNYSGNKLNDIEPGKIEYIAVLTGIEASAKYGSRGANGAIIISTKK